MANNNTEDKKIIHWTIKITWNDNTEEYLSDVPDWVAENVDEHLTEVEEEKNYEQRNK